MTDGGLEFVGKVCPQLQSLDISSFGSVVCHASFGSVVFHASFGSVVCQASFWLVLSLQLLPTFFCFVSCSFC